MRYKEGVKIWDEDPRMHHAYRAVDEIFRERPHLGEPVITSVSDGKHSENSYHYKGRAFDLRIRGLGSDQFLYRGIKDRIGHLGFDVVLEEDHIHVELDKRADSENGGETDRSEDGGTEGDEAGSVRPDPDPPTDGGS